MTKYMANLEIIEWSNQKVKVSRRRRRPRLFVTVHHTGNVSVNVAQRTTSAEIVQFLEESRSWIQKKLIESAVRISQLKRFSLTDLTTLPWLGEELPVRIVPHKFARGQMQKCSSEGFTIHTSRFDEDSLRKLLRSYYKEAGSNYLSLRASTISEKTGLEPATLKFRDYKTRWGSCSSKGQVELNWRLVAAHPSVSDYVIVHELAHLKEMNHSRNFWNLVEQHCPNFRQSKQWLKDNQLFFDFLTENKEF
ncbi:MAG: hypothetical protein COT74_11375 [Bdellovibrionales bacterium CG10_big_fil_rev_8_21_14_0_10_45_34]|nr:MAG: hypothetical protein COT74_11375 [Bdellovibrionales bacterium CG10_big_fil_rev_8_21_14_0_10_45_34]